MKSAIAFYRETKSFRDSVFQFVLSLVQPHRIVEVGTTRNLAKFSRFADGWATIPFADFLSDRLPSDPVEYAKLGKPGLYLADIDSRAQLIATRLALAAIGEERGGSYGVDLPTFSDGIAALLSAQDAPVSTAVYSGNPFHGEILAYLDGDNSEWGMKDQFEWCNPKNVSVLCDDFDIKGKGMLKNSDLLKNAFPLGLRIDLPQYNWQGVHHMLFRPSENVINRIGIDNIRQALLSLLDPNAQ